MSGLYALWYKGYSLSSFHFFDDSGEWRLMDKAGHITSSYYIGRLGNEVMKWTGMPKKKAVWYGAGVGFLFQTTIEVFDGFSPDWGFSITDIAANCLGSALLVGQELGWEEQRLVLKISFRQSPYAVYRPALLGDKFQEKILKDYNGQTCWLSGNLRSFLPESSRFPTWINLAIGYGAEGMIGGKENPARVNNVPVPSFERYSQYYLALDLDLSKIKFLNRSGAINAFFKTFGFIKIPAPALEYNKRDKFKFHAFYF
jgi:hypothetical protein